MSSAPPPAHPYFDHDGPLALAHRGFSRDGLENSMAAFAAAVGLGYRYVETDVHATADGVLVAFHDSTLDRVTDRSGVIAQLTWAEVRRARIGGVEPIPKLEDLLGSWPQLRVNIDVKAEQAVAPLAAVIEGSAAHHRVCVASFSDRRRRDVLARLSAPAASSAGRSAVALFWVGAQLRLRPLVSAALRGVDCLQVPVAQGPARLVNAHTVAAAHRARRQVHVWTVNDEPTMRHLLDLGVDGIVTDRADLLRDVLRSRSAWSG